MFRYLRHNRIIKSNKSSKFQFMAALVCILCSVSVELYRVGCVLIESGGSIGDCLNYLREKREQILIERYLENIDEFYRPNSALCASNGIKCINCRCKSNKMICDEVIACPEDFTEIERGHEAFECAGDYDHLLDLYDSRTNLLSANGIVFNHETDVEIRPGISFYVTGIILNNCEGFAVNLTYGHSHNDIALHVNPRLPQNYIVRNSQINGRWGKEEVTSAMPFTLKRGHPFSVQILVTETNYLISVNGLHFALFYHRVPYQRVTCLQVNGDVSDVQVQQLPVHEYPDRTALSHSIDIPVVETVDKSAVGVGSHLDMPFYGKLLQPFVQGSRLHIFGRVKVLPHSFYINLQHGESIWPHPTIAFHLNPRFANIGGKHMIVKNSWLDGKWDREERGEIHTDFMPSRSFHMTIECGDVSYNVFLNEKFIAEFQYRVKTDIVDTVYIQGDITLKHVSHEVKPVTEFK